MDNRLKALCTELGKMTSSQAADWLIATYPVDGAEHATAIALLSHRSWKRADQARLAKHYFKKLPFASSRMYEAFASFMSIELLVGSIRNQMPTDGSDINLLLYHLIPVLERSAKNDADRELIKAFVASYR